MAEFQLEIAGQVFGVSSLFESTRDYCRNYLTEKPQNYPIAITRNDLQFEQDFLTEEALQEGIRPRIFTDPFLERAAIQRKVAAYLIGHNTLLLHGSAVAVDGQGYLFTAKCGTGKSTHTRFWREVFGNRALMVNDDKPFVKLTDTAIFLCGAPWSGKHGLDTNITVPLQGICILERGSEDRIRRLRPEDAAAMLYKQSCPPLDHALLSTYHTLMESLLARVSLWHMECTKSPQAAAVAYSAMSE